jgi:Rhamnan synthesis protein F
MSSFSDAFRAWRRDAKASMPYVRKREHRILQRKYDELIDALGWTATAATQARLHTLKPLAADTGPEVCFFVSHATQPRLKAHVATHIRHLIRSGVNVVLIVNTDLPPQGIQIDADLLGLLSGVYIRENVGFDFAAWAHLYALCEGKQHWSRLFLVNDSIVGPLDTAHFDSLMDRVRRSTADVVGLTECQSPLRHVQSFFLVLNFAALQSSVVHTVFSRIVNLPSKSQVIDVYEVRLTQVLTRHGLNCEALFPPLSNDPYSANDTSFRWAELIRAGFPYVKTSIMERFAGSAQLRAVVPSEFRPPQSSALNPES